MEPNVWWFLYLLLSLLALGFVNSIIFSDKRRKQGYVPSKGVWKNWWGNYFVKVNEGTTFHQPKSVDEIIKIIKDARASGHKVKVYGGAHSWCDIAQPWDNGTHKWHIISLDSYNKLISLDTDKQLASVQAGIRLHQLHEVLDAQGFAFPVNGSISDQSLAGAMSTGTHSTGIAFGVLASNAVELDIVDGKGELITASREKNSEIFNAALVGIGALGIITRYTVKVVPSFKLEEKVRGIELEEFFQNQENYLNSNAHVKLWTVPHTTKAKLWLQNRTDKPITTNKLFIWWERQGSIRCLFEPLIWVSGWFPSIIPGLMRLIQDLVVAKKMPYVDKSFRIFQVGYLPMHPETEFCVPAEDAGKYVLAMNKMIEDNHHKVNMCAEIRFVKGDDIFLSPAQGRDSCFITLTAYNLTNKAVDRLFGDFQNLFQGPHCRPHWGKIHSLTFKDLAPKYKYFHRFLEIRDKMDPDKVFVNSYIARCLGV